MKCWSRFFNFKKSLKLFTYAKQLTVEWLGKGKTVAILFMFILFQMSILIFYDLCTNQHYSHCNFNFFTFFPFNTILSVNFVCPKWNSINKSCLQKSIRQIIVIKIACFIGTFISRLLLMKFMLFICFLIRFVLQINEVLKRM